ncbi:DUF6506 family protein [Xenorhabdus szentirmaii]|uniref:DUF6506 family protein n=1 Tax=Xenorhabdus szentirmaii TaxID=290112 RepID=UPI00387E2322
MGFDPSAKNDGTVIHWAKKLKDENVQFIELCGGFGPAWITKINEALDYQIPVGGVLYGPEFRNQLYNIMK